MYTIVDYAANANPNRRLLVQVLRLLFIAKNATVKSVGFRVLVKWPT